MAGHPPFSINYAIKRARPSLFSSLAQTKSLEVSLKRVGVVVFKTMFLPVMIRKLSYIQ